MTLAVLLSLTLLAQDEEYFDEMPMDMPPQQGMQPAPPGGKAGAKKTPDQMRLEKFLQLRFDRRETSILQALHPPKQPPREAEPKDAPPPPVRWWTFWRTEHREMRWWTFFRWKPAPDPLIAVIDGEVEQLQKDVTRGAWDRVRAWIGALTPQSGAKAYDHLLTSLLMMQMKPMQPQQQWQMLAMALGLIRPPMQLQPQQTEQNVFLPDDILGLADASPVPLSPGSIDKLGLMLRLALLRGNFIEPFMARLKAGTERIGGTDPIRRDAAVRLLIAAERLADCGRLLPTMDQAVAAKLPTTLNLLARYELAMHEKEKKTEHLERAWSATTAVLSIKEADADARQEAVDRTLTLVLRVRDTLGKAWLDENFAKSPELATEILPAVGSLASQNRHQNVKDRTTLIKLQSVIAEAALRGGGPPSPELSATLNVFVLAWLREAEATRAHVVQERYNEWEYDDWGNSYYVGRRGRRGQGQPEVIDSADLLETRPSDAWLKCVEGSLRPKFTILIAQLHLKAGEEEKAFEHIERVAAEYPKEGRELAHEFITTWTANHDPNQDRRRTSRYMYIYGYNPRADTIPLTRSEQVRNLERLAGWVKRLRALPLKEELDETLLMNAFTSTHSTAEVYRLSDLEKVFGSAASLKPASIAGLVQTMRTNLAGSWRKEQTQQQAKTKRKDKEIEAEVLRGYSVASEVVRKTLEKHPEDWTLHLASASVAFDENVYRSELSRTPEYSPRREEAFASFAKAAEFYAKALPNIAEPDEKSDVYEFWFYASLGAADLAALKAEQPHDPRQADLIRAAILALPRPAAERHMGKFASALQTRLQNVKPELKHRYLKAGLRVVGDHRAAREGRRLFAYYDDLVTEIKLTVIVDGPTAVGHGRPFGLFVDVRHTKEIERESGGFSKYLQNQNSGGGWYWNFGRPPVDYRDKFEEMVREALRDRFEVLSVTFHSDKIESRGDPQEGWRVTPYCYILAKAKGPEVDAIPPLRLDLDFLDTSGYCVLPVESPKIPIDATAANPAARPVEKIKVVQTLDERKFAEGKLTLEIRATARGLVPELPSLLDLKPGPFEVVKTEDNGVAVTSMDADSDANGVLSERLWTVDLRVKPDAPAQRTFKFASAASAGVEMVYQRYVDADLAPVAAEVDLESPVGRPRARWPWAVGATVLGALAAVALALARRRRRGAGPVRTGYEMPGDVNPFSVLILLRRMRKEARLAPEMAGALDESIANVERHYFSAGDGADAPDLRQVAQTWVARCGNGAGPHA